MEWKNFNHELFSGLKEATKRELQILWKLQHHQYDLGLESDQLLTFYFVIKENFLSLLPYYLNNLFNAYIKL